MHLTNIQWRFSQYCTENNLNCQTGWGGTIIWCDADHDFSDFQHQQHLSQTGNTIFCNAQP